MAPAHHNLCGSGVEHQSSESEGLRFDSSWGLRVFPLSHACDKMKKYLSLCIDLVRRNYILVINLCYRVFVFASHKFVSVLT